MIPWATAATAIALVTAVLGVVVSYQAYRGYRRNESAPMAYLAAGIFLLTVLSTAAEQGLVLFTGTGMVGALAGTAARVAGLVIVLYALTRA